MQFGFGWRLSCPSGHALRMPDRVHEARPKYTTCAGANTFWGAARSSARRDNPRLAPDAITKSDQFLFAGRGDTSRGLTTRQYARLVAEWVASVGLDPSKFGTHSLRRTKAVLIYRRTGNLRAVQLLVGHSKIESTVRYLGIEVDDAIEIAEKIDI
jgi:integrase